MNKKLNKRKNQGRMSDHCKEKNINNTQNFDLQMLQNSLEFFASQHLHFAATLEVRTAKLDA
jgi:hypothetical protein